MKKSNLMVGMSYIILGVIFLAGAMTAQSGLSSLLFGFSGGFICPGLVIVYKYFYWSAPRNRERYEEKLERERIELEDEMKKKLRDQSGRYAYLLGLAVISVSIVIFSVLKALDILESRVIILFLGGYLALQIGAGILIFKRLLRKYMEP